MRAGDHMHQTDVAVAPIRAADRITAIDALRGFALLGVFLANLLTFSGWVFLPPAERIALAGPVQDAAAMIGFIGLLDGKFYSLFSMLFGAGFAIQLSRLQGHGADGVALFRRRMTVLLGIGLFHLIFVWFGDILTLYALLGFVLVFMRGWSDRRLLWTAVGLIVLVVPLKAALRAAGVAGDFGLFALVGDLARLQGQPDMITMSLADTVVDGRTMDWDRFFGLQFQGVLWRVGYLLESARPLKVLALMMLGLLAGRRLIAGTLLDDRRLLGRVLTVGLLLGVPGNALYVYAMATTDGSDFNKLLNDVGYALGVIPLALAYGSGFLLAWPRARVVLGVFTPAGRMALTNYLTQSLVGTFVFYGVGLGLFGRLAPVQFVGLGLAVFAAQILVSAVWLRLFRQGPVEALWRRLTYGRR